MKWYKYIPGALVVFGILFGVFLVNPACYAGGAAILTPADDIDVPQGSQIPESRKKEIEKKVREYQEKSTEKDQGYQQEQSPQNQSPEE